MSPPIHLDFDLLSFRFSGASRAAAVELLVDGLPVLATPGRRQLDGVMADVTWPVHAWRGKTAYLMNMKLVGKPPA